MAYKSKFVVIKLDQDKDTLQCLNCGNTFEWDAGEEDPEYCPICGIHFAPFDAGDSE